MRTMSWFCSAANSLRMICSQSWRADSLTPSCRRRCRRRSVDTAAASTGAMSSLFDILGNISLTACSASIHDALSSRVSALRCSLFVPVKIENLLSSDLLSLIEDTCRRRLKLNLNSNNDNNDNNRLMKTKFHHVSRDLILIGREGRRSP